jgi:dethiobiotin synthetase
MVTHDALLAKWIDSMRGLFITSVGTGIGKTLITTILCHQLTCQGRTVAALKPVVSGFSPDDPASDPALILRSLGRDPTPAAIAAIAPWRFEQPLSPQLAARLEGRPLAIEVVAAFCNDPHHAEDVTLLIEGAGGVMTPLDETHTIVDLIARLGHPAVLVTGSYLGALSHTLTALFALRGNGIQVNGIVVSESVESAGLTETVDSLHHFAGGDVSVHALPRLAGDCQEKWSAAPSLLGLCDIHQSRST